MTGNPLLRIHDLGQSVWYDNIHRGLLESGDLAKMVTAGEIQGVTSNPAIFDNAIGKTDEYATALRVAGRKGLTAEALYELLAIEDIRAAADILLPVFENSAHNDGFVSLEVSPRLAQDAGRTLTEARRLWTAVARPNLMIKIPGTEACLPAVRDAIAEGININITLLFDIRRYRKVMEAYQAGLEERLARGLPLAAVHSVASFFISRVDTLVDAKLDTTANANASFQKAAAKFRGKAAIANARLAYQAFQAFIQKERFQKLVSAGGAIQKPLWASTSTKDPAYPDTYYADALIAPQSVNTMPPQTVDAVRSHGNPAVRIEEDLEEALSLPDGLSAMGISLEAITAELELQGLKAFQTSFESMLGSIRKKIS